MGDIPIPEIPEFTEKLRRLEPTDPANAELFNSLYAALLGNDVVLKKETATVEHQVGELQQTLHQKADRNELPTKLPAEGGDAATVNGHTVNADVPAEAKFTDTVYSHPATSGNRHIPAGGAVGQVLKNTADGTAAWQDAGGGFVTGTTAPAKPDLLWIDTGSGVLKYYNGTGWVPVKSVFS